MGLEIESGSSYQTSDQCDPTYSDGNVYFEMDA